MPSQSTWYRLRRFGERYSIFCADQFRITIFSRFRDSALQRLCINDRHFLAAESHFATFSGCEIHLIIVGLSYGHCWNFANSPVSFVKALPAKPSAATATTSMAASPALALPSFIIMMILVCFTGTGIRLTGASALSNAHPL